MQIQQTFSAVLAFASVAHAIQCSTGAVVFCVSGSTSNENINYNAGSTALAAGQVQVATAIVNKAGGSSTGSYYTAVPYPAITPSAQNLQDGLYQESVAIGTNNTQNMILDYVNSCPQGSIFVIGYSQGAQVVSGTLAGCTPGYCNNGPIHAHNRITGAVNFADPGFQNNVSPIDAGNATTNGVSGTVHNNAAQYSFLKANFSPRFRSYCQAGDAFCNSGTGVSSQEAGAIHGAEPSTYAMAAITFLEKLL